MEIVIHYGSADSHERPGQGWAAYVAVLGREHREWACRDRDAAQDEALRLAKEEADRWAGDYRPRLVRLDLA